MEPWHKYLGETYELVDVLKKSAEGSVALVYDRRAKQVCIMKQRAARSRQIYQKLKGLKSPFVPQLYHLWEEEGQLLIIEEYIDGSTLEAYLEQAPARKLDEKEIVEILRQLCACLEPLHREGLIHRDIKPANIMLTKENEVKLIDFGIARLVGTEGKPDTEILGTRGYAAPEQYGFGPTDARTDIYALGIMLRQLLGRDYHGYLEKVLSRCTAMEPAQRYQSVAELWQDVCRQRKRRRGWRWAVAAALLVVVAFGLWHGLTLHWESLQESSPQAEEEEQGREQEEKAVTEKKEQTPLPGNEAAPSGAPALPLQSEPPAQAGTSGTVTSNGEKLQASVASDVFIREENWQNGFMIDEATWREWQRSDGSVHLPPEWTIRVHVENPSGRDYPRVQGRLRIIRPYAEPEVLEERLSEEAVLAGETKDFVYPLAGYPLAGHTTFELTFDMYQADGKRQPVAYGLQTSIDLEKKP